MACLDLDLTTEVGGREIPINLQEGKEEFFVLYNLLLIRNMIIFSLLSLLAHTKNLGASCWIIVGKKINMEDHLENVSCLVPEEPMS